MRKIRETLNGLQLTAYSGYGLIVSDIRFALTLSFYLHGQDIFSPFLSRSKGSPQTEGLRASPEGGGKSGGAQRLPQAL